jgi:hypothetical protein
MKKPSSLTIKHSPLKTQTMELTTIITWLHRINRYQQVYQLLHNTTSITTYVQILSTWRGVKSHKRLHTMGRALRLIRASCSLPVRIMWRWELVGALLNNVVAVDEIRLHMKFRLNHFHRLIKMQNNSALSLAKFWLTLTTVLLLRSHLLLL